MYVLINKDSLPSTNKHEQEYINKYGGAYKTIYPNDKDFCINCT